MFNASTPHRADRGQPDAPTVRSPISKARTKSARWQFGELYERALGILYHLQKLGAKRGDKLILFLGNNEQFIDAFWGGGARRHHSGAGRAGHQR